MPFIQKMARHKKPETTARYCNTDQSNTMKAARLLCANKYDGLYNAEADSGSFDPFLKPKGKGKGKGKSSKKATVKPIPTTAPVEVEDEFLQDFPGESQEDTSAEGLIDASISRVITDSKKDALDKAPEKNST